ncbi:MAG: shikimate kinase [Candidatus Hodarchaeales archaeon]
MIFGPPAVGKMAVGLKLAEKLNFKLFHNHMTIELLVKIFDHETAEFSKLDNEFRFAIFEEFSKSNQKGLIFTFVWALNIEADKNYVKEIMEIFLSKKRKVYLIELESDLKTRLQRNKTELRLAEKPTKRAIDESEQRLLKNEKEYIFNTNADNLHFAKEILNESNFLKINNNNLTIDEVVKQIIAYFNF